jgi:hypothetical protein
MEHTNEIIINVLRNTYPDYDKNKWHYDLQYNMIFEAIVEYQKKQNGKKPYMYKTNEKN